MTRIASPDAGNITLSYGAGETREGLEKHVRGGKRDDCAIRRRKNGVGECGTSRRCDDLCIGEHVDLFLNRHRSWINERKIGLLEPFDDGLLV